MTFSDETLMAYVDGELEPQARAALDAALAADAQLAQRVAAQRALRARLQQAFAPVLDEPVPERLLRAARGADAPARRLVPRWSWPQWGALAATLVLGALLGSLLRAPPFSARDGRLLASGALAGALSQQLASTQSPDAPVQIGISFRARDGAYCRSFRLGAPALAGLACRQRGAWRLEVLAAASAAPASGGYRPAAAAMPAAVTQAVDALIAGEPLDAAGETQARERSWQR